MSTSTCTTYNATRSSSPATSPFYAAECAFERLTTGPTPLTLDGAQLGEPFPAETLTLDTVRKIVLRRSSQLGPRDAVWAELVHNAQTHGGDWTIAAVGMALPALKWLGGAYGKGTTVIPQIWTGRSWPVSWSTWPKSTSTAPAS